MKTNNALDMVLRGLAETAYGSVNGSKLVTVMNYQ